MDAISVGSLCDIAEDVRGVRRQCVSLSSVDSEPILKRCRRDLLPRSPNDDDTNGAVSPHINGINDYEDDDDDTSDVFGRESTLNGNAHQDELLQADTQAALCDANGEPLVHISIERVSEGMVASVTALIPRDNTVIADNAAGALVMDAGTRICLTDGSVVGVIAAVMGPVSSCAYAIVCFPSVFSALQESGKLAVGVDLCYDLGEQCIIYDPIAQCDTRRGTDASYINDEELPPHARPDFSDDEAERQWKMSRRMDVDGEPLSSDDEPVDVDWEKISALEGCLRDETIGTNGANELTVYPKCKLVIPPWVAAVDVSKGGEGGRHIE